MQRVSVLLSNPISELWLLKGSLCGAGGARPPWAMNGACVLQPQCRHSGNKHLLPLIMDARRPGQLQAALGVFYTRVKTNRANFHCASLLGKRGLLLRAGLWGGFLCARRVNPVPSASSMFCPGCGVKKDIFPLLFTSSCLVVVWVCVAGAPWQGCARAEPWLCPAWYPALQHGDARDD